MVLQLPPNIFCTQCWNLSMHCGDVHVGEEVLKSLSLLHEHTHTHMYNHIRMHTLVQQTCHSSSSVMIATDAYRRQTSYEIWGTILWVMDLYLQYQWHAHVTTGHAGDTNACGSGQKISRGSIKKVKDTQHNLATSGSQVCMGISHHTQWKARSWVAAQYNQCTIRQAKILNRDMGKQFEWKWSQCWYPGRPVWMSQTWTQMELINVGHY